MIGSTQLEPRENLTSSRTVLMTIRACSAQRSLNHGARTVGRNMLPILYYNTKCLSRTPLAVFGLIWFLIFLGANFLA
jgi:hypothetical protein